MYILCLIWGDSISRYYNLDGYGGIMDHEWISNLTYNVYTTIQCILGVILLDSNQHPCGVYKNYDFEDTTDTTDDTFLFDTPEDYGDLNCQLVYFPYITLIYLTAIVNVISVISMIVECINPQFFQQFWYENNDNSKCQVLKWIIRIVLFLICAGLFIIWLTMSIGIAWQFGNVTEYGPDYDATFQTFVALHVVSMDIWVIVALICEILSKDKMMTQLLCLMSVFLGFIVSAALYLITTANN